ncbi:hypothetical protein NA56DRAFT_652284 [Hyaloscypha hepaticicola]|uniref:Uncharacterized protein n=1 Tax=Hyaloscypha hepaticicola TaxID=2082293 RepID=A0A2J6PFC8_9HELO|nr:hypothetical protein NA56DRAFT_652284 [Hyaloscypha hepaticicola]
MVQPVQPRGLNNPTNGANVGFNHVWPPRPANDAGAGFNPIQSPGLGNHSLGGDLAQRLEARRIELALERLSMKSPDRKTPSSDYTKIKQKSRKMMDAWRDMKDKLRQQGYQISDSSDSDTDSDRDSDRHSDRDSDRDSVRDSNTDSDKDSSS